MPPPADVDAHPQGASPFGVMDLVGNVWQWTDEFFDEHTRAAAVARWQRLSAPDFALVLPTGVSARSARQISADGAEQGSIGGPRIPLRSGRSLTRHMRFLPPSEVQLEGLLGQALAANHRGRLTHFVVDETSPAIALFDPQRVQQNQEGDWYGEHAGKWLYAAARAANRTADEKLAARIRRVADYLVSLQEPNGYLGTYAPARRFMNKQPPATRTWDGAPSLRTWDIWTHSYLILGLLEVHKYFPAPAYLDAAARIGDLCWHTLTEGGIDITRLGNHHGMSATVLLDAAVELFFATRNETYLDLARLILKQADERPELQLLSQALAGADASEISTGKAYQLCWNLVGMAKLQRATGDLQLLARGEPPLGFGAATSLDAGRRPMGRSRASFSRSVQPSHCFQSLRLRRNLFSARMGTVESRTPRRHRPGEVRR